LAQVSDVIDKVARQLLSGTVEERNKLSSALNSATTSIPLTYELGGLRAGSIIEVGSEQMYVWEANQSAKILTVERGFNGTDPSTHSNNTIVTRNPRFPRNQILEAINAELADLSSPMNGLFTIRTLTQNYNGTDRMIDLPGAYGVIDLYEVRLRYLSTDYPRFRKCRIMRDAPVDDFPSGFALVIDDAVWRSGKLHIAYKAEFDMVSSENDDLCFTSGLPSSAEDIIILGAQIRLMAPREIKRNFTESQGDSRRPDEVPPGSIGGSITNLLRLKRDRVTAEALKLTRQYPTMLRG